MLMCFMIGISGSGKTTLATQIRNARGGGWSESERVAFRGEIYGHVVRAARLALEIMHLNGKECAEQYNRVRELKSLERSTDMDRLR